MLTTGRADADHFHDECGVFGIYGHPDAAALTALGLHALQHRGQEAAGIVAYDGSQFNAHRGPGLVGDNFGDRKSTRLNSSHRCISYAVFCLKKKNLARKDVRCSLASKKPHNAFLTETSDALLFSR